MITVLLQLLLQWTHDPLASSGVRQVRLVYSSQDWGEESYPVWMQTPHLSFLLPGLLTYSQSSSRWQSSLG